MKAHELLSDKSKWTQGCYALNSNRKTCSAEDDDAQMFCGVGAICRCYPSDSQRAVVLRRVHEMCGRLFGRENANLILVNEGHDLGYDAVMKVLREADV